MLTLFTSSSSESQQKPFITKSIFFNFASRAFIMSVGHTSGSSPCTFMKISASICSAASASRSVPVSASSLVKIAWYPASETTLAIASLSVAT